ncbi:hypothetical protein [Microbacterium sp. SA39]|uniref:hypothetical protein n=1 Tax=Microbacterium sp. SA39 TaxID=1263625 RepID=UPI0005F9DF12|nr:hypothetical protein [Microbacterium sp. SA39]
MTTCIVLVGFAALMIAGASMPEHRWWFHAPAVLGIVTWYLLMMARYEDSVPEKVSWFGTLTRPVSHFIGTTTINALSVMGWAISTHRPDWQPAIVIITLVPMLTWFTFMSYVHRREEFARAARMPNLESGGW